MSPGGGGAGDVFVPVLCLSVTILVSSWVRLFRCMSSGGYNLQDVVFYWTRGNDSVKGLDTLRLAQYSIESYYTSVSEAVYETGKIPPSTLPNPPLPSQTI